MRRKTYERHGQRHSATYRVWCGMLSRCQNPNGECYQNYGGRGITVCARWQLFSNFYADIGDKPAGMSLDRIDNNDGYHPGNCRWATRTQQNRNKRNVPMISANGIELTVPEWAARTGIKSHTIRMRLSQGWDPVAAVTTPLVKNRLGVPRGAILHKLPANAAR